jgi:hypothetical protein
VSDYLAIATVTATLASIVRNAMFDVPNLANAPDVRIARPLSDPNFVGAHLFLYRVAPNGFLRNEDLPTRNGDGRLVKRPSYAADLEYLISFYGNDQSFEPQRLLGRVVAALHAEPVLSAERIRSTIENTPVLAGSTLDRELQPVRIVPITLGLEDLSRMWSVFYQTPYSLTLAYAASVVMIDADATPAPAAGVAQLGPASVLPRMPRIDSVEPPRVVAGLDRTVTVRGSGLAAGDAVRFGGVAVASAGAGDGALTAEPPPVAGRISVDVVPAGGAPSAPATIIAAPLVGAPSVSAAAPSGRRTLGVATNFAPDPRHRYTFLLYGTGGGPPGIELDALVSWLADDAPVPQAAGETGAPLAAAINAAIRVPASDAVTARDVIAATDTGWRIAAGAGDVALHPGEGIFGVAWGLPVGSSIACDVTGVAPGRYAVALRVDGDSSATSAVLRGSRAFDLPGARVPDGDAPLSPALRDALVGAGVALSPSARTRTPVRGGAYVVTADNAPPAAWLDTSSDVLVAYALAPSGPIVAPLVDVPA